jgi:hypothetical protein
VKRRNLGPIDPSGVYGLVISGSVMAAAGELGSIFDVTISVVVTVFAYWMAEAYSQVLGGRIVPGQPMTFADVARRAGRHRAMVETALVPLGVVLLAYGLGASRTTAVDAGLVVTTLLLTAIGWIAASRRGSTVLGRIVSALAAGSFGVAIIGLKAILH